MVKDGGESSRGPVGLSAEGPMGDPGSRGRALTRMPDSGQYPTEKTLNQQIWDKKAAKCCFNRLLASECQKLEKLDLTINTLLSLTDQKREGLLQQVYLFQAPNQFQTHRKGL